jgi:alpha-D-xyloside xylohydrolase
MYFDTNAWERLGSLSLVAQRDDLLCLASDLGDTIEASAYGEGVFRLRIGPRTKADYGLILGSAQPLRARSDTRGGWALESGEARLEIAPDPLRIRLTHGGREILASITDEHFRGWTRLPTFGRSKAGESRWTAAFALVSGEAVYGLGEKYGPLDKRGQLVHSHVEDALGVNTGLSYKNAPFAWSPRGWGLLVHTPGDVSHGVGHPDWSHRSYAVVVEDEALDLFLFAADSPAQMLERYTALTGRAPDVPLWGLGLWVSKAYYRTADEAIAVAADLRRHRIPCDVLTLDGRAVWEVRTRFDFRFDPARYPDPKAALAKMREHGLRICVWEYPYVSVHSPRYAELAQKGYFLKARDGTPHVFRFDTAPGTSPFGSVLTPLPDSSVLDFTHPDAYAWWRDAHEPVFAAGVDVIKSDFGEHVEADAVAFNGDSGRRLHNVYPLLYNRCVYEATERYSPSRGDGPPMVWGRAGWTGSQRYPMQWGGDPQSDWEGLAASIRGGLSWGMSGVPYFSTDVGGFYGSRQPDPELYLRWLQMSVFSSHFRVHGIGDREPWHFGAEALAIARDWIEFRYRLLPYLQGVVREAARTGLPVMRAMPLAFPGDRLVQRFETQFLCGDALLVAPIVAPGGELEIALPAGSAWYDLSVRPGKGGMRYEGGRVYRARAKLDQFPVFGREGHVLPLGPVVQHTGEIDTARPLDELWVFGEPRVVPEGLETQVTATMRGGRLVLDSEVPVRWFGVGAGPGGRGDARDSARAGAAEGGVERARAGTRGRGARRAPSTRSR